MLSKELLPKEIGRRLSRRLGLTLTFGLALGLLLSLGVIVLLAKIDQKQRGTDTVPPERGKSSEAGAPVGEELERVNLTVEDFPRGSGSIPPTLATVTFRSTSQCGLDTTFAATRLAALRS